MMKPQFWHRYRHIVILICVFVVGLCLPRSVITRFTHRILSKEASCYHCNVVIISIDTVRADELPCFGYRRNTTPNICRFADNNLIFENAHSQSTWTFPNQVSFLTSLYQSNHTMESPIRDYIHPAIKSLPQLYKEAGYHTIFIGPSQEENLPLRSGLARYFDEMIETNTDSIAKEVSLWKNTIASLNDRRPTDPPVFLYIYTSYVHNYIVDFSEHTPSHFDPDYTPPPLPTLFTFTQQTVTDAKEELRHNIYRNNHGQYSLGQYKSILSQLERSTTLDEAKRAFLQLTTHDQTYIYINQIYSMFHPENPDHKYYTHLTYDNRLYNLDSEMSGIFDVLETSKLNRNTLSVLLSDHGENFGIHGFGHAGEPTDGLTHVPLVMKIPEYSRRRIQDIVELIDVFPTLLSITGITSPHDIAGLNLVSTIKNLNQQREPEPFAISELNNGRYQSIRTDKWRFTLLKTAEGNYTDKLFYIPTDPDEATNVAGVYPDIVNQLKNRMKEAIYTHPMYPPAIPNE